MIMSVQGLHWQVYVSPGFGQEQQQHCEGMLWYMKSILALR